MEYDNMTTTSEGLEGTTTGGDEIGLPPCDKAENDMDRFFVIFFFLSLIVVAGLAFIVRRRQRCLGCCWGRPGCLQPVDFVDEVGRRWAYAACFVILANNIFSLFYGGSYWNLMKGHSEEWLEKYGWLDVFSKMWEVLSICVVYYPLLACIDHRRSIAANIVGFVYTLFWIVIYSGYFVECPMKYDIGFFGVYNHLYRIPVYIAFYIVGFAYVLDFVKNIKRKIKKRKKGTDSVAKLNEVEKVGQVIMMVKSGDRRDKIQHHWNYVSKLLSRRKEEEKTKSASSKCGAVQTMFRKLVKKFTYEKISGFCYSTRIVCSITIAVTTQIWILLAAGRWISGAVLAAFIYFPFLSVWNEEIDEVTILLHISSGLAGLVIFLCLFNTLISYKRCWHQLLRGDHSWHPYGKIISSPQSTLLSGLKFGGYQVAYVAWGWAVLFVSLWLLLMFVTFALVLPLARREINWLIRMLIKMWPTLLLGIVIIPVMQLLVCRFLFLQNSSTLALTNRRVYNSASYYFLVLNIIVGVFSCLKRILIPLVLGILFLSRLDMSLVMKGFETKDPGYTAFVSMLFVDLYHNHPVVRTFVVLLMEVKERGQLATEENEQNIAMLDKKRLLSKRIRNRWRKTVTLVNNPSLALEAVEKRLRNELRGKPMEIRSDVDDDERNSAAIEIQSSSINADDNTPTVKVYRL